MICTNFSLLLQASTGNLNKGFFNQCSGSSWPWPHPLISKLTTVRALWPANTSADWKLPIVSDRKPLQTAEEQFLCPFVLNRREMVQPVPTKGFLQPIKTASLPCAVTRRVTLTHLAPPIPPFLLAQNLSSKRIAPTDNMVPNLHEYTAWSSMVRGLIGPMGP